MNILDTWFDRYVMAAPAPSQSGDTFQSMQKVRDLIATLGSVNDPLGSRYGVTKRIVSACVIRRRGVARITDKKWDSFEWETEHLVHRLIQNPHPQFSAQVFWTLIFRGLVERGCSAAVIRRRQLPIENGSTEWRPYRLLPVESFTVIKQMSEVGTYDIPENVYRVKLYRRSDDIEVRERDMLTFWDYDYDGWESSGPSYQAAGKSIATLEQSLAKHMLANTANGTGVDHALETIPQIFGSPAFGESVRGDSDISDFQKKLELRGFTGPESAGKIPRLPYDAKLTKLSRTARDAQQAELRKWALEASKALWVSLNREEFNQLTVGPYLRLVSDEMTRKLLSVRERMDEYCIKFDNTGLGDLSPLELATYLEVLVAKAPTLSPNDARGILGRPPKEGADNLNSPTGASPSTTGEENGNE